MERCTRSRSHAGDLMWRKSAPGLSCACGEGAAVSRGVGFAPAASFGELVLSPGSRGIPVRTVSDGMRWIGATLPAFVGDRRSRAAMRGCPRSPPVFVRRTSKGSRTRDRLQLASRGVSDAHLHRARCCAYRPSRGGPQFLKRGTDYHMTSTPIHPIGPPWHAPRSINAGACSREAQFRAVGDERHRATCAPCAPRATRYDRAGGGLCRCVSSRDLWTESRHVSSAGPRVAVRRRPPLNRDLPFSTSSVSRRGGSAVSVTSVSLGVARILPAGRRPRRRFRDPRTCRPRHPQPAVAPSGSPLSPLQDASVPVHGPLARLIRVAQRARSAGHVPRSGGVRRGDVSTASPHDREIVALRRIFNELFMSSHRDVRRC